MKGKQIFAVVSLSMQKFKLHQQNSLFLLSEGNTCLSQAVYDEAEKKSLGGIKAIILKKFNTFVASKRSKSAVRSDITWVT